MSELQFELQKARGVHASSQRIQEAPKQQGFTRKCVSHYSIKASYSHAFIQVTRPALERNEDTRAEFQIIIAENYVPEQLVFIDETACNRTTTKQCYAWSLIGTCAQCHDYFVQGKW
jgi:hypothetical protein